MILCLDYEKRHVHEGDVSNDLEGEELSWELELSIYVDEKTDQRYTEQERSRCDQGETSVVVIKAPLLEKNAHAGSDED